jgi:general secretion pathway protein H
MGSKVAKVSMPISVTGISTSRRGYPCRGRYHAGTGRSSGFSLLELLIVVVIISVFAGAAILSIGVVGSDREIEREALRLRSLLDVLREEALMQSRDFGVFFAEDGYRFYSYDYQQLRWVEPPGDRLLAARTLKQPLNLSLTIEDRELVLRSGDDVDPDATPTPQVMILSSGEITPFDVAFYRDLSGGRFVLSAGLDGTTELTQDGFDGR